jgi:hypothetical protein
MANRRKNLICFGAIITSFVIAFVYLWITDQANNNSEEPITLDRILSDLDEKEAGWRLEDLEAQRQAIPDDENAALCVLTAHKLLPKQLPIMRLTPSLYQHHYWQIRLDEKTVERFIDQIDQLRPALTEAHRLEKLPRGRFPISYPEYGLWGREAHRQPVLDIAVLLENEALVHLHTGHFEEAWQGCIAILNAARSLGDEPVTTSQDMRMKIRRKAVEGTIEILKRGEVSDAALATTLKLFEKETCYPLIQVYFRAQRGNHHRLWTELDAGRSDATQILGVSKEKVRFVAPFWDSQRLDHKHATHASVLNYLTKVIELLYLPLPVQNKAAKQLKPQEGQMCQYAWEILSGTNAIFFSEKENHAILEVAILAFAAERYRLNNHHWPELISDMIPDYLPSAPLDPVDGNPMLYRRLPDRIMIYSPIWSYDREMVENVEVEILNPELRRNSK